MKRRLVPGVVAALVLLVLVIAIPSLLRGRMRPSEHPAIGDIRTVLSAQAAFQAANGGFHGPLSCLEKPTSCIAGYSGPTFIDPVLASLATRNGYLRRFHPGPAIGTEEAAQAKAAPSSFRTFAYVAIPEKVGQTGVRAFCGDSSGVLCSTMDGVMPEIEGGRCPQTGCPTLR